MRFIPDHDLHIHTNLSPCSTDSGQTAAAIMDYARSNGLKQVCVTDHFWDDAVCTEGDMYARLNFDYISRVKPLPTDDNVEFLFGCEVEMDQRFRVGMSKETADKFDFVIAAFSHMHLKGMTVPFEPLTTMERVGLFVHRFERLLDCPTLPDGRTGIAHPIDSLITEGRWAEHIEVIEAVHDSIWRDLFERAAARRFGVELNFNPERYINNGGLEVYLRPFNIARDCGCKFYFGSDAHTREYFNGSLQRFNTIIDVLGLKEEDKFKVEKAQK